MNINNKRQAGFTLIELMIAVVIGLLGIVIIFQVLEVNENFRRTTVSRSDAQSSGAIALFLLERYVRSAGASLVTTDKVRLAATDSIEPNGLFGCEWHGLPSGGAPNGIPALRVAPVVVIDGSDATWGENHIAGSDTLFIMSGTADLATSALVGQGVISGPTSTVRIENVYGLRAGDWLLFSPTVSLANAAASDAIATTSRSGSPKPSVAASRCAVRRSTTITPDTAGNNFGPATVGLASALPSPLSYNSPPVQSLGQSPYFLRLRVEGTNLVETDFLPVLDGGTAVSRIIAEGVVNMQIQYGIDQNRDDVIDAWVEPKVGAAMAANTTSGAAFPASTVNWSWSNINDVDWPNDNPPNVNSPAKPAFSRIKGLRIGIVSRSPQFEKSINVGGQQKCFAANPSFTPAPLGSGSGATFPFPTSLIPLPARTETDVTANDINSPLKPSIAAMPAGSYTQAQFTTRIAAKATSAVEGNDWRCYRYQTYEAVVPVRNMIWSPL